MATGIAAATPSYAAVRQRARTVPKALRPCCPLSDPIVTGLLIWRHRARRLSGGGSVADPGGDVPHASWHRRSARRCRKLSCYPVRWWDLWPVYCVRDHGRIHPGQFSEKSRHQFPSSPARPRLAVSWPPIQAPQPGRQCSDVGGRTLVQGITARVNEPRPRHRAVVGMFGPGSRPGV